MLLITVTVSAQVNDQQPNFLSAGLGIGNAVFGNLSYTHHNTGLQLSGIVNYPMKDVQENPINWVAALGLQLNIVTIKEQRFYIIPQIGYTHQRRTDYNNNLIKGDSWYFGLETCTYVGQGTYFIQANYTTRTYVAAGIRYNFDL